MTMAAWQFVVECNFPAAISVGEVAAHVRAKNLDFDVDLYQTLPMESRESSTDHWEQQTAVRNTVYTHLLHVLLVASLQVQLGHRGVFSDNDPAWFATRADEFTVLLEKIRVRVGNQAENGKIFAPHVHLAFNRFHEACQLARQSYSCEQRKFLKIAQGEIQNDPVIMRAVKRKTDEKYETLCSFFQHDGFMPSLSADYAFDGELFFQGHPFSAGSGGIHTLLLDVVFSRVAYDYLAGGEGSCCGLCSKPPTTLKQQKIAAVTSVRNMYGIFDAIGESPHACARLKRLSLMSNRLEARDCCSLRDLLEKAQIEHLNIAGITVSSSNCWSIIVSAVLACRSLVTVNLSLLSTATDADMSQLLMALGSSMDTLTEVICDGSPSSRGTAGSLCTNAISSILSFPNVISLSFEYQGLEPSLVAFATKKALNNKSLVRMSFLEDEHVEWVQSDECCCGEFWHCCLPSWFPCCWKPSWQAVRDRPSESVMREIDEILKMNRDLIAKRRLVLVVIQMIKRYRQNHQSAEERKQLEIAFRRKTLADAVRHEEELRHRKELELRAASATRTNVLTAIGQSQLPAQPNTVYSEQQEQRAYETADPL